MISYLLPIMLIVDSLALILPPEWARKGAEFLREMAPRLAKGVGMANKGFDAAFVWVAKLVKFDPIKPFLGSDQITHVHIAWLVSIPIAVAVYLVWNRARKSLSLLDDLLMVPVSYIGWGIIARILFVTGVPGGKYLLYSVAFPVFFGILALSLLRHHRRVENVRVLFLAGIVWLVFLSGLVANTAASGLEFLATLRESQTTSLLLGVGSVVLALLDLFGLIPERQPHQLIIAGHH